jgi:glyoxylase-like metal-dependent hydrolase (beta-lactamase superfamily II)
VGYYTQILTAVKDMFMRITESVHALKLPFKVPLPNGQALERYVHVYMIYSRKNICLIDSGVSSSSGAIFDYIRSTGRQPEDINLLVLTHSHPDHIGSAKTVKKSTGCAVAAHPAEKAWIEDTDLQARERPVPGFHSLVEGPVNIEMLINEGNTINLGDGLALEVLHTPGHSKGSISLLLDNDGVLFSGDAVISPGDLPLYENGEELLNSIAKIKKIAGIEYLLSSWADPVPKCDIQKTLNASSQYVKKIHAAVLGASGTFSPKEPGFAAKALSLLGLGDIPANPIVLRALLSHIEACDKPHAA